MFPIVSQVWNEVTSDAEHGSTEGNPGLSLVGFEELDDVPRIDGFENRHVPLDDVVNADHADGQEPSEDHRWEHVSHFVWAKALDAK